MIKHINLNNFRNHRYKSITIDKEVVIITGNNASGKTSILEAISLLSPGKGIRKSTIKEMIRQSNDEICDFEVDFDIDETKIAISTEKNKKYTSINGKRITNYTSIKEKIEILWLSPEIILDIIHHTSERRKFFDRMVFSFFDNHAEKIIMYEKLIHDRMQHLLKNQNSLSIQWLDFIERQIVDISSIISHNREQIVNRINELSNDVNITINLFESNQALQKLEQNRIKDSITGKTNFGIHRNEVIIKMGGRNNDIKLNSSGEQKNTILQLMLSAIELLSKEGKYTIFLLDEAFSFLDKLRKDNFLNNLLKLKAQSFLTSINQKNLDDETIQEIIL